MRMLTETFPEFTEMLDRMDDLLTEKRPVDEKTYQFLCFVLSIKGRSVPDLWLTGPCCANCNNHYD